MLNLNVKIKVPLNHSVLLEQSKKVILQHEKDGDASLLHGVDMAAFKAIVDFAESKEREALEYQRLSLKCISERNIALGIEYYNTNSSNSSVLYYFKLCGDWLSGLFRGKEEVLSKWGFEILGARSRSKPSSNPSVSAGMS